VRVCASGRACVCVCVCARARARVRWRWAEFVKQAVEMDSVAMAYIQNFMKISSGIQKFIGRYTQTHRQDGDRISLL
jgi:hypothetical protein